MQKLLLRALRVVIMVAILMVLIDRAMLLIGGQRAQRELTHPKIAILKPVKVFQIGFSKCGTVTIANFFSSNGVPTIHHDSGGKLPLSIYQNHLENLPLISPEYEKFYVFTDLDLLQHDPQISIGQQLFRELDRQYPNSKFILNTRPVASWLKSRSKQKVAPTHKTLLEITSEMNNMSRKDVLTAWELEWNSHHKAVFEYFKDRPNDLLVFDIKNDSPSKIVEFFKDYFVLDASLYEVRNQTR